MTDMPFECRPVTSEQAEQNMKAAHPAHEQLTDLVTKVMDTWKGAMRAGLETDVQDRAAEITKKNAELACALAETIAKARQFLAPIDNDKPSRGKSTRSKAATSGTSTTPVLPPPSSPTSRRSLRSKAKAANKETAASAAVLPKDK